MAWNGLKHCTKMKRLPAQTLLGAQPGSGTQPCYKVSTDHWVKNGKKNADSNIGLERLFDMDPKWAKGQQSDKII